MKDSRVRITAVNVIEDEKGGDDEVQIRGYLEHTFDGGRDHFVDIVPARELMNWMYERAMERKDV